MPAAEAGSLPAACVSWLSFRSTAACHAAGMRDPTPDPDRKAAVIQDAVDLIAREMEKWKRADAADAMSRRGNPERPKTTRGALR